jgi:prevent-host-death family protein
MTKRKSTAKYASETKRPSRVSEPHTVNLYEAKTRLSELVDRAAEGEEIVIAKAGTPMARLVPLPPAPPKRTPGLLKEQIWVADDFDDPLPPEIQKYFDDPVIFPPDVDDETSR